MTNQEKLKYLREKYNLTYADISTLLNVSWHTVKSWLVPLSSKRHRNISDNTLELLELKLKTSRRS